MSSDTAKVESFSWFSELLRQLLAYSSVFVALSYLFGRSYFLGYFTALGINTSLVELSWFDYVERGWFFLWTTGIFWVITIPIVVFVLAAYYLIAPLIDAFAERYEKLYLALMIMVLLVLVMYPFRIPAWNFLVGNWPQVAIVFAILAILVLVFRKTIKKAIAAWRRIHLLNPKYLDNAEKLLSGGQNILYKLGIFLFLLLFTYSVFSAMAQKDGENHADSYLNEMADRVEVVSLIPLAFSPDAPESSIYSLSDLRFLYFNNGHYFFSRFDDNCKPKEIFIVDEANVVSVRVVNPFSEPKCP